MVVVGSVDSSWWFSVHIRWSDGGSGWLNARSRWYSRGNG